MVAPTETIVCNAFVNTFYQIMHNNPELVYRFYNDSSTMMRPDLDGIMVTVNGMEEIKDLIDSLNYKDFKAEINKTFAHAYMNGVYIFVMGCMTGKNNVKRNFTELFHLAPQNVGFFVHLDVFKFTDEDYLSEDSSVENNVNGAPATSAMLIGEMAMVGVSLEANPETLGLEFVNHYYRTLHQAPELIHKFYRDSSTMSRPGPDGTMVTVTAQNGIKDLVLSLNFKDFKAEILTLDRHSFVNGMVILVTGCLTGTDNLRRNFTESFRLAPQDKGYFILNAIFRFIGDNSSGGAISKEEKDANLAPAAPVIPAEETKEGWCVVNNCPQRQQREKTKTNSSTSLPPEDAKETTSISEDKHNSTFSDESDNSRCMIQ